VEDWLPERGGSPANGFGSSSARAGRLGSGRAGRAAPGRGGMSEAEEEAVKRFQAFVTASGMGDMIRAEDGRMWDMGKSDAPQVRDRCLGGWVARGVCWLPCTTVCP